MASLARVDVVGSGARAVVLALLAWDRASWFREQAGRDVQRALGAASDEDLRAAFDEAEAHHAEALRAELDKRAGDLAGWYIDGVDVVRITATCTR